MWAYPGKAQIFSVPPIISGTREDTNFKFGTYIRSVYPTKRLLKNWEKKERWRIQGLSNFLNIPPIISGTRKATNFKFGKYIQRVHANKSPLKILEYRERGRNIIIYCIVCPNDPGMLTSVMMSPNHNIWGQISWKRKELGAKLLRGAYRKVLKGYRMVTSPMTSRDPMTS